MSDNDKAKVNLDLLKKLVSGLEKSLGTAEAMNPETGDVTEYIAELARASGLAGVIAQEAGMLVKDIYTLVRMSTMSTGASEGDVMAELDKLFAPAPKRNAN
jgi:hypothetical protein